MDDNFTYKGVLATHGYDDANHGVPFWYAANVGVTLGYSRAEAKRSINHYLAIDPNFFNDPNEA